jgi:hypothetical protein
MSIWRSAVMATALATATLAVSTATASAATFTPTGTLHYQSYWPDSSTPDGDAQDYVGLGTFSTIFGFARLVVSSTNLTLLFDYNWGYTDAEFNGPVFSDLTNSYEAFSDVVLDSSSVVGFDLSRIIFDDNSIGLNLQGLDIERGQSISIDVNPVPIPAALPLLATAIGGLGVFGHWRRRRAGTATAA